MTGLQASNYNSPVVFPSLVESCLLWQELESSITTQAEQNWPWFGGCKSECGEDGAFIRFGCLDQNEYPVTSGLFHRLGCRALNMVQD